MTLISTEVRVMPKDYMAEELFEMATTIAQAKNPCMWTGFDMVDENGDPARDENGYVMLPRLDIWGNEIRIDMADAELCAATETLEQEMQRRMTEANR